MTPDSTMTIVLYILGGAVGFWIIIAIAGSLPLLTLSKVYLEPTSDEESQKYLQKVLSGSFLDSAWASENNFEPVGVYRVKNLMGSPILVGWKYAHERTYLCMFVVFEAQTFCDCVSVFKDSVLTTSTIKDGQTIPPGREDWIQSFDVSDMGELWNHHRLALDHIAQNSSQVPLKDGSSLAEDFEASIHRQADFLSSITLWPLRVPYWYFVRRAQRHNKALHVLLAGSK